MENMKLAASERTITGKAVKKLRRVGIIPATVFGKDLKSQSIQVTVSDYLKVWKKAGGSSLVDLTVGDGKARPVFIKGMQKDPVTGKIYHVDFHQVNLKEKITTTVPLISEGESPIAASGEGLVLFAVNEVEVEGLPTEIPHQINVDISKLTEIGQTITLKDLKIGGKVELKTDPETVIVTVQNAEMKEEVVEEAPAAPEVLSEKPAEGEEEVTSEGEETKKSE